MIKKRAYWCISSCLGETQIIDVWSKSERRNRIRLRELRDRSIKGRKYEEGLLVIVLRNMSVRLLERSGEC